MEALPLLKLVLGELMVLLGVPLQHPIVPCNAHALAECTHDPLRISEHLIRVDEADLHLVAAVTIGGRVTVRVTIGLLASNLRPHNTGGAEVVEDAPQLVVAGFFGHEVAEARDVVEGRDGAAPVARDAVLRVADEEGEVELAQNLIRDHGRVLEVGVLATVDDTIRDSLRGGSAQSACTDAALDCLQRRGDGREALIRWREVVSDVFDEDTLVLRPGQSLA